MPISPLVIAIIGLVVLVVLIGLLVASRYKVAGPNEAFIVTGRKGKEVRNPETGQISADLSGQKVVMGGGVFVVPFIQRLFILDLSSRRIMVQIRGAVSGQGIKLTSTASHWSRSAATRTPSGQQHSASSPSRTRSRASPRKRWQARCVRSSAR